jgi:hypothetical protein
MKAPAADVGRRPVADDGDEPDALVDDLGAQLARPVGLDVQAQRALAALLDRVRDELGHEQLHVRDDVVGHAAGKAFDGLPRGGGGLEIARYLDAEGHRWAGDVAMCADRYSAFGDR